MLKSCFFVWACVRDCDVAVLLLGMLCDEKGFTYSWVPGTPPTLEKEGFEVTCYPSHNVPIICPALKEISESEPSEDDNYETVNHNKNKNKNKNKHRGSPSAVPAQSAEEILEHGVPAPVGTRRSRP